MKLLFDNICFDLSDTIIPLLPKIMNFTFLQSLNLLFHPAIYALVNCSFFIWDPEKQYEELLQEFKFKCPKPNCKKILQNHGWSKSIRIERTITSNARILVCKSYQCFECSQANPNCRSSSFDAVHPDLMSQLPDSVRIIFPFILNPNGALLSKETLTATMALIENGAKFNQIVQMSREAITTSLLELEMLRRYRFETLKSSVIAASPDFSKALQGNTLDFLEAFTLTSKILRNMYRKEANRQEPFLQRSFYQNLLVSDTIAIDMVHPYGNDGNNDGTFGIWVALGSFGEVIGIRAAVSKSIIDASAWFQMMQDFVTEQLHQISAIFNDNPTIDEKTLKKIFGEKIAVLKDIFHLIQGLFKICKQTAKHKVNWEDAVARLFWLFSSEDIDREKRRELERGQDKELSKNSFVTSCF